MAIAVILGICIGIVMGLAGHDRITSDNIRRGIFTDGDKSYRITPLE